MQIVMNDINNPQNEIDKITTAFGEFKKWHQYFSVTLLITFFPYIIFYFGFLGYSLKIAIDQSESLIMRAVCTGIAIASTIFANRMILYMLSKFIRFKLKMCGESVVLELRDFLGWNYVDIKIITDLIKYDNSSLASKVSGIVHGKNYQDKIEFGSLGKFEKGKSINIPIKDDLTKEVLMDNSVIMKITMTYFHVFTGIKNSNTIYITNKHLIEARCKLSGMPSSDESEILS